MPKKSLNERFDSKVALGPGCLQWMANRSPNGYGQFPVNGRIVPAHRFAYERQYGPIPKWLETDHLCRNRACVNPDHIEIVTHRENTLRGMTVTANNFRKTHCPLGHSYDEANTYIEPKNKRRHCRICKKIEQIGRNKFKKYHVD